MLCLSLLNYEALVYRQLPTVVYLATASLTVLLPYQVRGVLRLFCWGRQTFTCCLAVLCHGLYVWRILVIACLCWKQFTANSCVTSYSFNDISSARPGESFYGSFLVLGSFLLALLCSIGLVCHRLKTRTI